MMTVQSGGYHRKIKKAKIPNGAQYLLNKKNAFGVSRRL
jgi:hypothetical protein